MRMLAAAAGRMQRPMLAAALTAWRDDWHEALEEGQRLLRAEAEGHSAQQQAELDALREELAAALKAKEEELHSLAERLGGEVLTKEQEHARALAETLEAEKDKRIEHAMQMAAHRLGKQQLSKGWQTWLDGWLEHQRHKRMLAASAGRMQRPMLAAALVAWREDWAEERQRMVEEGHALLQVAHCPLHCPLPTAHCPPPQPPPLPFATAYCPLPPWCRRSRRSAREGSGPTSCRRSRSTPRR